MSWNTKSIHGTKPLNKEVLISRDELRWYHGFDKLAVNLLHKPSLALKYISVKDGFFILNIKIYENIKTD